MYDRLLVPLDGSALAEGALPYAALIPSRGLDLIHVESPLVAATRARAAGSQRDAARDERNVATLAYLDGVAAPLRRQGRRVTPRLFHGDPAPTIAGAATAADLIVMTTRGRGAAGRSWYGSVADRVAREAPAPTLLLRGDTPVPPAIDRVVVPLDGSDLAERALPVAARLARTLGVGAHLLRVVEPSPGAPSPVPAAVGYLDRHRWWLTRTGIPVTVEVRHAPAAAGLLDAIAPADLVVMATRGHAGVRRLFEGSTAETLIRRAAAPVLIVRATHPIALPTDRRDHAAAWAPLPPPTEAVWA